MVFRLLFLLHILNYEKIQFPLHFTPVNLYPACETATPQLNVPAKYPEFQQDPQLFAQPLKSGHAPEHLDVDYQKSDAKELPRLELAPRVLWFP